jgi:hypothetical protein
MPLAALLIVFFGYTAYQGPAGDVGWGLKDIPRVLLTLSGIAALFSVPWLATTPRTNGEHTSIEIARKAFATGATCAFLAIAMFVAADVVENWGKRPSKQASGSNETILRTMSTPVPQ